MIFPPQFCCDKIYRTVPAADCRCEKERNNTMKRSIAIFTAALLCVCPAGCGSKSSSSSQKSTSTTTATTTTAPEETTTAAVTEAEVTTTTALTTAAAATEAADQLSMENALELITALSTVDKLNIGVIGVDYDTTHTDANGTVYYKVNDENYKSVSDIRSYLNKNMTDNFVAQEYFSLIDGDSPAYIDADGALYANPIPRGGRFSFTGKITAINSNDDGSCTIVAANDNYGELVAVEIDTVKENGSWKISGVSSN